ncbi:hypothetical protein MPSEU_000143900 [Mayamaea pseudoterrestris]|nr:hypothetical protein MPSEU_000143900 [Mayamaea pseudoterrestris]
MSSSRKRATRETVVHHSAPLQTINQQQQPASGNRYMASQPTTQLTEQQPQRRLVVRVKRFHAVAQWTWNAGDPGDVCSICQNAYESTAPGIKYPGDDCPVVYGKCKHAFHLQCVGKWLSQTTSKNSCPICRQDWEFGSNPTASSNDNSAPTAQPDPSEDDDL